MLALPDVKSSGATKEEALEKLIQLLQERKPEIGLSNSNIGASRQNTGKVFCAKKRMNNRRLRPPQN
ncbi:hypothetical protein [Nostoc sp.]